MAGWFAFLFFFFFPRKNQPDQAEHGSDDGDRRGQPRKRNRNRTTRRSLTGEKDVGPPPPQREKKKTKSRIEYIVEADNVGVLANRQSVDLDHKLLGVVFGLNRQNLASACRGVALVPHLVGGGWRVGRGRHGVLASDHPTHPRW